MNNFELHRYDDIINLPHHISKKHLPMSRVDRAAQFGAFAALSGHDAAISETGRLTDDKLELSEDVIEMLNIRLQQIMEYIENTPEITVIYFKPDELKSGGEYVTYTGNIRRIDEVAGNLIFCDETEISIDVIYHIESDEIIFETGIESL